MVANGSGTVGAANVSRRDPSPASAATAYTVAGTVSGLAGSALLLRNSGGLKTSRVTGGGRVHLHRPHWLPDGAAYAVTVKIAALLHRAQNCARSPTARALSERPILRT